MGASTLSATVAGVEFEIKCLSQMGTATVTNSGSGITSQIIGTSKHEYTGCEVLKPIGGVCTVEQPIKTSELKQETVLISMEDEYEPVVEKGAFVTLNISGGGCPAALKGSKAVTGSATSEGSELSGEASFTRTSGSALKFAGQPATFLSTIRYDTFFTNTQVFSRTP